VLQHVLQLANLDGQSPMVEQQPSADQAAEAAPQAAQRVGRGRGLERLGQAWAALAAAARVGAPIMRNWAARFGNWLVSIGWGKFILLSILLIALAAMTESLLVSPNRSDSSDNEVPVDVKVQVDSTGLHISAPPRADGKSASGKAAAGQPNVQIDDKGVRIRADKDGRDVSVVIDHNGVRVEEAGSAAGAAPKSPGGAADSGKQDGSPKSGEVTVVPEVLADPDKVAEAVEAARDQIEKIVQDQVNRKLAHQRHRPLGHVGGPDFAELAVVLLFGLLIVRIALRSKRRAESRAQVADAAAAEEGLKRQLAEAQLKTMQAQVEPHFLFNTLASVDYLIETDPARASRMQKNLIQYLRAALPQMRQGSSTLGQELALCRSYLEILKVRMDERLHFAITMPAGLSTAAFPPMMLQTLVENSIKHGLEPKPEGGALTLTADVVNGNLRVAVSDTGLGFGATGSDGGGVGLNNVRERLKALFGSRARLTIEANSPTGTIVTIEVPYAIGSIEPTAAANPASPPASPQPA
jgi:hypothetical protein